MEGKGGTVAGGWVGRGGGVVMDAAPLGSQPPPGALSSLKVGIQYSDSEWWRRSWLRLPIKVSIDSMLVCKIRKVLICVCTSCRGDTEVVYKRGRPASRFHACQSYVSIVKLLFHWEPPKLANGLDMAVAGLATSSRVDVYPSWWRMILDIIK